MRSGGQELTWPFKRTAFGIQLISNKWTTNKQRKKKEIPGEDV
jgi:hypothetical protein